MLKKRNFYPSFYEYFCCLFKTRLKMFSKQNKNRPGSLSDRAAVLASLSGGLQKRSQGEPEPLELGSVSSKGKNPPGFGLVRLVLTAAP